MELEGIVAIVMVCSIPLLAIGGSYFLKYKRMQLEKLQQGLHSNDQLTAANHGKVMELELAVQRLDAENRQLKERLTNVETIVTSVEWDQVLNSQLPATDEMKQLPPSDKTVS